MELWGPNPGLTVTNTHCLSELIPYSIPKLIYYSLSKLTLILLRPPQFRYMESPGVSKRRELSDKYIELVSVANDASRTELDDL